MRAIDRPAILLYIGVHMNYTVPITQFRKDLFAYAKKVAEGGHELEVEKDGKAIFKVTPVEDDVKERGRKLLELSKKIGGKFKNVDFDRGFFRGKKELDYWKRDKFK